ncbi:MAG: hypothetical protein DHS20C13_19910 [Thermodesulfobacteriota bacterium]|nr:MAG: hypothetical protein DHS20C13_19910 [Thermodesulfobacteriota bacterium]
MAALFLYYEFTSLVLLFFLQQSEPVSDHIAEEPQALPFVVLGPAIIHLNYTFLVLTNKN